MRLLILIISFLLSFAGYSSNWQSDQRRVIDYKISKYCMRVFESEKLLTISDHKKKVAAKFCEGDFESPPCLKTRSKYTKARKKFLASIELEKELSAQLDKHKSSLHLDEGDGFKKLCQPYREKLIAEKKKEMKKARNSLRKRRRKRINKE
jgi:hypothetical protein